jgi:hypothetical protein
MREKDRIDNIDPMATKPRTESERPNRLNWRTEKELPIWTCSITESFSQLPNAHNPSSERFDPARTKPRREKQEPHAAKDKTERADPKRAKLRTLKDDDIVKCCTILQRLPSCAICRVLMDEPNCTNRITESWETEPTL